MSERDRSDDQLRLAALVREYRRAANLTQAELAEKLGVHQTWVSKVEVGERRADVFDLAALARALDVPLSEFMRRLDLDDGREPTT